MVYSPENYRKPTYPLNNAGHKKYVSLVPFQVTCYFLGGIILFCCITLGLALSKNLFVQLFEGQFFSPLLATVTWGQGHNYIKCILQRPISQH